MRPGRIASGTRAGERSRAKDTLVGLLFVVLIVAGLWLATTFTGTGGSEVDTGPPATSVTRP